MKSKKFDLIRLVFSLIATIILLIIHFTLGDENIGEISINLAIVLPFSLFFYFLNSYDLYIECFKSIKNKSFFNEVTLSIIATIAAFAIGDYVEGLAIVVFFQIGENFEKYALNKSRNSIKDLLNLRPDIVTLINEKNEETVVDPFDALVGSTFIVKPGERVPLDGIIINGSSFIDTSSLTGESVPRKVKENEEILSGVLNKTSPLIIKSTKEFSNSTMSKILDIVENSSDRKTKSEKFITRFAKIYTPIVIVLAFIVAIIPPLILGYNNIDVWTHYIKNAASLLVISCPCSIVLSIPMAYFVSLGNASKHNILIKGSTFLEKFGKIQNIILDKTGTITKGNFKISKIEPSNNTSQKELLELAQIGESFSNHPIAVAIKEDMNFNFNKDFIKDYKEIDGKGIYLKYQDKVLLLGNSKLLEEYKVEFTKIDTPLTIIYLSYDSIYKGYIEISDEIKESSKLAISNFYKNNVKEVIMLTGDNEGIAKKVGSEVNVTSYHSSLLPLDKANILEKIIKNTPKNKVTAFVGDGINDAPSLVSADLGIAMGGIGSDLTIDSSDVVIMNDDLNKINEGIKISHKNRRVVLGNIIFALSVKFIVMILSFLPLSWIEPIIMWLAIFADVGVTIICVLNSLRLMKSDIHKNKEKDCVKSKK